MGKKVRRWKLRVLTVGSADSRVQARRRALSLVAGWVQKQDPHQIDGTISPDPAQGESRGPAEDPP